MPVAAFLVQCASPLIQMDVLIKAGIITPQQRVTGYVGPCSRA
jgi:hypothetical protein